MEKLGCNKGMADQLSENQVTDEKRFSCGLRLSEVGLSEIRKPQVAGSIPVVGSSLFSCFAWRLPFIRIQRSE